MLADGSAGAAGPPSGWPMSTAAGAVAAQSAGPGVARRCAEFSRYYRRTAPRLADWGVPHWTGLDAAQHDALLMRLLERHDVGTALRIARAALMCRLIEAEIGCGTPVDDATAAISRFAERAVGLAAAAARDDVAARLGGRPLRVDGGGAAAPAQLLVAGMGKLGAGELNVSSDIDLVYLYDVDGEVVPGGASHHEFFARVGRRLTQLLQDVTEHGFVFRVDTRLRPNGDEGPPVCSLDMFEQYLTVQGRPWERFAWLRARLLDTADAAERDAYARAAAEWQSLVTPFVYRRYADFGMIESLRALHAEVRADARARAARNPAASGDIKRSRGGIRELEFFVQLLQLVRGGVAPELRERHTRRALARLAQAGVVEPERARALDAAYDFLRRLENRIQYLDDAQTHNLPSDDADLERLAATMELPGTCGLLCCLNEHRENVAAAFDSLLLTLGGGAKPPCNGKSCGGVGDWQRNLQAMLRDMPQSAGDAAELHDRIVKLLSHRQVQALSDPQRRRLGRVVERSVQAALQQQASGGLGFLGDWLDWLAVHCGRTNYLAFFDEHPQAIARLLALFCACPFAAKYLRRYPGVVDELVAREATAAFDAQAYRATLAERLDAIERAYPNDAEPVLDALRRAHQVEVFRLVLRDIEEQRPVEAVSDDLSALADSALQVALDACWKTFAGAHRAAPRLAAIGYGKLGSKELGYASDLDLVLIYDQDTDDPPDVGGLYTQFAKRWINWLTAHTSAGRLFDIDTRLRPNGNAGLLVTSLAAFDAYQRGRGGNTAWTWEHQALTKARFVAGDACIGAAFEAIRRAVLAAPRDAQALRAEVLAMRARIRAAHHRRAGWFDLKHDPGGLVDCEFAVQYWILAHGAERPELLANSGTIALVGAAARCGLVDADTAAAAQAAYRALRARQHRLKLAGSDYAQVPEGELQAERDAVRALWRAALGADAAS